MSSTVLIITNELDVHADAVARELRARDVPVFRFHPEDFPQTSSVSLEIHDGRITGEITTEYQTVALEDIRAAWYRQPQRLFHGIKMTSAKLDDYVKAQTTLTLTALYQGLDAFWVGDPHKLRLANIKALQLAEASKAGLQTPHTLISNDPKKVSTFVEQLGDAECAIKPLLALGVTDEQGYRLPLTTTLPKGHPLDSVALAPNIFQPYIHKAAELRVVVMGEKIFSAEILSQDNEATRKDWRAGECSHKPYSLPVDVQVAIHRMMDSFGINFSSIDMVVSPEGEHVFLELNPNGQWLWLEEELGLPLVTTMADLLTSHHPNR